MYNIAENIFTEAHRTTFDSFKLQALVVFSDTLHPWFAQTFSERAKALHDETGHDLVIFAATRPFDGYETWQNDHETFKAQQLKATKNLSVEAEQALCLEFARLFDLDEVDLPAIILAPCLWKPHFVTLPGLRHGYEAHQVLYEALRITREFGKPRHARRFNQSLANHFMHAKPPQPAKAIDDGCAIVSEASNMPLHRYSRYLSGIVQVGGSKDKTREGKEGLACRLQSITEVGRTAILGASSCFG